MSVKSLAARLFHPLERLVERVFPGRAKPRVIDAYIGYATPDSLIARGRVLSGLRRHDPDPEQSRWVNLRQMISLFLTDEVANATVVQIGGTAKAVTDEEGYFTLVLPPDTGTLRVAIRDVPESAVDLPVIRPDPAADVGVISDIDDTLLETGAYSIWRNLWTTLTGNTATRRLHPDAVDLITRLHAGRNPVFYVSSSPWNLHFFLQQVFMRAGMVPGPMFLRDFGISETQFITGTHGDHKGAAIDTILSANPDLPFVLVGDTGQHDAEVYLAAARRHPGRVARVILRAPGPGADAADMVHVAALRDLGVPVAVAADYSAVLAETP